MFNLINNNVFERERILENKLFPYLEPQELGSACLVNKTWEKAAKTENLWKRFCAESNRPNRSPYKNSWRLDFILNQNFLKGHYVSQTPVEYKWIPPLDPKRHQACQVLDVTATSVTILDLHTNTRTTLKMPNFDSSVLSSDLISLTVSKNNYVALKKSGEGIVVHDKKTGELYWEISLPEAQVDKRNWDRQTLICNDEYLASIEEQGRVLRVWDLKKKNLYWEDRFAGQPFMNRDTNHLHFTEEGSLLWLWHEAECGPRGLWFLNLGKKIISEKTGLFWDPVETLATMNKTLAKFIPGAVFGPNLELFHLDDQGSIERFDGGKIKMPSLFEAEASDFSMFGIDGARGTRAATRNISIRENLIAIAISYFRRRGEGGRSHYSRLILWDSRIKKSVLDREIDHFASSRIFLTEDSILMSGDLHDLSKKRSSPTLLRYSYDPETVANTLLNSKPAKPSLKLESKQSEHPQKSLWERIVLYAKRIFAFIFSPIKWLANTGLEALKTCVKVIRFPFSQFNT